MSSWLASHPVVYPALEAVYVTGIALLVGDLVLLEARVLGFGQELPLPGLARLASTLSVCGFGVAAFGGSWMFATQPAALIANRAFVIKMGFLTLAGASTAYR